MNAMAGITRDRILGAAIVLILLGVALALPATAAQAARGDYAYATHVGVWNEAGADARHLKNPKGVALDTAGDLFVVDGGNCRVVKYEPTGDRTQPYRFVTAFGSEGVGPGLFSVPEYIAVDSAGNVYVTDSYYNAERIHKYAPNGTGTAYSFVKAWGLSVEPFGAFVWDPAGIAIGADGGVYVVDWDEVAKFTPDGGFLARYKVDYPPGATANPDLEGLACDQLGNYYVADSNSGSVMKYTSSGSLVTTWHIQGTTSSGAHGVACHPDGQTVFVASGLGDAQRFEAADAGGVTPYSFVCNVGGFLPDWQYLGFPFGVACSQTDPLVLGVSRADVVFVAGESRHAIVKFARDFQGPTTKALKNVAVKRGKFASLRYRITDNIATTATDVKIVIKKGSKIVKKVACGWPAKCGTGFTRRFRCTLKKGTYKYLVWAKDEVGNKQISATAKTLRVN